MKKIIKTDQAPAAIGTYSQAVQAGNTVYISGQIPLDPNTMQMVSGGFKEQAEQCFKNFAAVVEASGGDLSQVVKLSIFLQDLSDFAQVNEVMAKYFSEPYPARAAMQVAALPKSALIEIEGIVVLTN